MVHQLLSVKELSNLIKVKKNTVYAWASQKRIPHIKLCGKILFDPDEIKKWVEKNKVTPVKS